ncbi:hypothetical protein HDV00_000030 [Rhizophlyctis rosea]|nr:hypothetical protein HDV00_000030 [Rhizophlyctis rosea]
MANHEQSETKGELQHLSVTRLLEPSDIVRLSADETAHKLKYLHSSVRTESVPLACPLTVDIDVDADEEGDPSLGRLGSYDDVEAVISPWANVAPAAEDTSRKSSSPRPSTAPTSIPAMSTDRPSLSKPMSLEHMVALDDEEELDIDLNEDDIPVHTMADLDQMDHARPTGYSKPGQAVRSNNHRVQVDTGSSGWGWGFSSRLRDMASAFCIAVPCAH